MFFGKYDLYLITQNFNFNTMWTFLKTKKLSILVILAGLTYAFLIFSSFAEGWDDMQRGWHEGNKVAEYNKWGDVIRYKPSETESYILTLKAKKGFDSYPDSLLNLKLNQAVQTKYSEMVVLGPKSDSKSQGFVFKLFALLFAAVFFIVLIRIPIHFYKLISLIKKEIIFELEAVRKLRWLGFELLLIYVAGNLVLYLSHREACYLFSFTNYEIVMPVMDPIWLLLGIVSFLMAEILSKAIMLKEEQELTI